MNSIITEVKVLQARVEKPDKGSREKFSENLVKQLIRHGEDRKTSIEETKLIED